jgi:hypothetical protein
MFHGSFRPAQTGVATNFCKDGRRFSIAARTTDDRKTEFRLQVSDHFASNLGDCAPPMYSAFSGTGSVTWSGSPDDLPTLVNPAVATGNCRTLSSPRANTEAFLATSMGASEMLDHYARQLEKDGWTRERNSAAAFGTWTKTTEKGPNRVALLVTSMPDMNDCKHATLTVGPGR